jgi:hypothetical protein
MPRVDLKSERACDYKLRMSTGLRSKVERSARKAKRSANKEMVARLESTFDEPVNRDHSVSADAGDTTKQMLEAILSKVATFAGAYLENAQDQRSAIRAFMAALDGKIPKETIADPQVQVALEQLQRSLEWDLTLEAGLLAKGFQRLHGTPRWVKLPEEGAPKGFLSEEQAASFFPSKKAPAETPTDTSTEAPLTEAAINEQLDHINAELDRIESRVRSLRTQQKQKGTG